MPEVPPLTKELARRIEQAVVPEPGITSDDAHRIIRPTVRRFGQTVAIKAKGGRSSNRGVFCFGQEDLDQLDEILKFYAADSIEPSFYVSPMGFTREVAMALTDRGFSQQDFNQAILYGLPRAMRSPLPDDVTIEQVTAANLHEFAKATADGNEWPSEWRDAAIRGIIEDFKPISQRFLLRYQGVPAGVGSLTVRDGLASLTDAAIVPRFRTKGFHGSLICHRLNLAAEMGCELIVGSADFASTSFHNQQRFGLRLAYIETAWRRGG